MQTPKILLTGFGGFLNHSQNPTADIIDGPYWPRHNDIAFHKEVLPVPFKKMLRKYKSLLKKIEPDFIINLGLSAVATTLQLEKVAINFAFDPEESSEFELIESKDPAAYHNQIAVRDLAHYLCRLGIPAQASMHAGTYTCNMLFYKSLQWCKENGGDAIFVHMPYSHENMADNLLDAKPARASMSRELQEAGVDGIIDYWMEGRELKELT